VNSDLIYDVLRKHQPDHILLRATRADAARGLTDLGRMAALLGRARGKITHMVLSRVSLLAVPVLLEIGRSRRDFVSRNGSLSCRSDFGKPCRPKI
jgi:ATP-dependent helicase Lhr and Lhr-like helicase